jgi:ATP-dependent Clp protease ATP-binding subunit ClpC
VAEEGFDPEFGARPLRRTIQRRVDNELSRMVLEGSLNPADKVVVDLEEGKLTFGVLGETSPTGTASQIMTDE